MTKSDKVIINHGKEYKLERMEREITIVKGSQNITKSVINVPSTADVKLGDYLVCVATTERYLIKSIDPQMINGVIQCYSLFY